MLRPSNTIYLVKAAPPAYSWDFENRMTSVTLPGSGGTVSFKYDPFGRRIYKSSSSGTSVFAYDGDNLAEETNSSGTAVARYADGLNIDEPLAMLRGGATSFYHADGLGSVTSLSSSAGSIANTYTYDSFGNLTASTGSVTNPFRYTARESDPETGLYYYRARYYDANPGRFLSEDPAQFYAGSNFYRYAFNNSTNLIDPSGLGPLDKLLNWLKPIPPPPPPPCPPKFPCDADGLRTATPFERGQVLAAAAAFPDGFPYGGKSPDQGFDCSGYVCWVVRHSVNSSFPNQAAQVTDSLDMHDPQSGLMPIGPTQAGPGDIVLFPRHVGFLGPNGDLLSARGDPEHPEKAHGVGWAPIAGFKGVPIFLRLRVPCNK